MSKHFWLRSFALTIVRDPLRIVGQMSTEESKQKFLLECVESEQQKESDRLISGPRNTSFQRVQVFNSKLVATCCEWFDVGAWPTTLSLRSLAVVKVIGANSHDFLLRKGFELVHPIAPSLLRSFGEGCCCSVNRVSPDLQGRLSSWGPWPVAIWWVWCRPSLTPMSFKPRAWARNILSHCQENLSNENPKFQQ